MQMLTKLDCVYRTNKARQLVLTGLVRIETGCGTRVSGGGGTVDFHCLTKLLSQSHLHATEVFRRTQPIPSEPKVAATIRPKS